MRKSAVLFVLFLVFLMLPRSVDGFEKKPPPDWKVARVLDSKIVKTRTGTADICSKWHVDE
jgi:hypothetical protein